MHQFTRRQAIAAMLAAASLPTLAPAANNTAMTVIRVSDMHCANCAGKIARKLYTVPGVVQVKTNLKAHSAYVTPQQGRLPSPRAMWEAVESAGFEPVQLEGPHGAFTAKPQQ